MITSVEASSLTAAAKEHGIDEAQRLLAAADSPEFTGLTGLRDRALYATGVAARRRSRST